MLRKGTSPQFPLLQASDIVYVPDGKTDINTILAGLSALGTWEYAILEL